MRAEAKPGLEVEPVDEVGRVDAQAGATTMVGAAITKDIRGRCTMGSSTSHPRRRHNSRTPGNSSSSSSTSRNFHRDRTTSSPTLGEAGKDHLTFPAVWAHINTLSEVDPEKAYGRSSVLKPGTL